MGSKPIPQHHGKTTNSEQQISWKTCQGPPPNLLHQKQLRRLLSGRQSPVWITTKHQTSTPTLAIYPHISNLSERGQKLVTKWEQNQQTEKEREPCSLHGLSMPWTCTLSNFYNLLKKFTCYYLFKRGEKKYLYAISYAWLRGFGKLKSLY